ncbi:MAG: hypothetical protein IJM72_03915, partial [Deltaproteobacteria bacterium]|nr:hypothetical protein [Deltaproteobacteria bacterium]
MRKSNFLSTIVGRGDRGIGWMLVLSLLAHALVMVLAVVMTLPTVRREEKRVYYVDLISKPVINPKAGHPEGGSPAPGPKSAKPGTPGTPGPAPQPPAQPVSSKAPSTSPSTPAPKAAPQPKAEPQPKAKPQPKTAPQAKPEPAPAKPAPNKAPQAD